MPAYMSSGSPGKNAGLAVMMQGEPTSKRRNRLKCLPHLLYCQLTRPVVHIGGKPGKDAVAAFKVQKPRTALSSLERRLLATPAPRWLNSTVPLYNRSGTQVCAQLLRT